MVLTESTDATVWCYQAVRDFCADPQRYAEREAEEARKGVGKEGEEEGEVQGSVETVGWQAFKRNESAVRNEV